MWKAIETSAREVGVGKTEGRRGKRRSREKEGRKGEEITEKGENSRS